MTVNEVARLAGRRPVTIRALIARGKIKAVKRGRDWHIAPAEAHRYANGRKPKDGGVK